MLSTVKEMMLSSLHYFFQFLNQNCRLIFVSTTNYLNRLNFNLDIDIIMKHNLIY